MTDCIVRIEYKYDRDDGVLGVTKRYSSGLDNLSAVADEIESSLADSMPGYRVIARVLAGNAKIIKASIYAK